MARQLILQNLMKLARGIGANPKNFMGTRTNITFLGKGPTKNPLFQSPIAGLEGAGEGALGSRESMIGAVEDAMGFATANKLNGIQLRALELNLESIFKIYNPPALPSASVTNIGAGIEGLRRFPKESHKFFGRPLKSKDFAEIDRLVAEGKLPPAGVKGATSVGPVKGRSYTYIDEQGKTRIMPSKEWSEGAKRAITEGEELGSRLPGSGSAGVTAMLDQKTAMSRAIARQILQQDTRLNLRPEELYSLRTGGKGADPLDIMEKYYGESMLKYDEFLNSVNLEAASPAELADMVLKHIRLVPQFARGGLARILEV